ncbi:MAG: helix-turn-helix transcriptional regulator [Thermodesulfobacteriota bacterium]
MKGNSTFTGRLLSVKPDGMKAVTFLGSLGITRQHVSRWRREEDRIGYPGIHLRTVVSIAQVLGVNPPWLLFGVGPKTLRNGDAPATTVEVIRRRLATEERIAPPAL